MAGYTKLFSSIITSTVWREPAHVKLVWITMLALSDRFGLVEASVPGLADMARVKREECEDALRVLSSPDPDSRTKDNDGRRIVEADGGWRLLNHAKYREKMGADERRQRNAEYMRDYRARKGVSKTTISHVRRVEHTEADPDPKADPEGDPEAPGPAGDGLWPAGTWLRRYAAAWSRKYGTLHYGQASDGKACGQLADLLAAMPAPARKHAESMADGMIGEFLGRETPKVIQARHPFVFFVTEFGGLMVPQKQAAAPVERCTWHRMPGTASKAAKRPDAACVDCKHLSASKAARDAEPAAPPAPVFTAPAEWTEEQRRELAAATAALRKGAA
jgi:hypothetical protein